MARRERKPPPPPPESYARLEAEVLTLEQEAELTQLMAERVLQVRAELGLTQEQLARAFGRSQPWTREVEAARQRPPHYLLLALAKASGRSVGWFFGEREPRRRR